MRSYDDDDDDNNNNKAKNAKRKYIIIDHLKCFQQRCFLVTKWPFFYNYWYKC